MTDPLSRAHAVALDAADPLRRLRDAFVFPQHGGQDQTYFVGNSLGLQPRAARAMVAEAPTSGAHSQWKATSPAPRNG